MSADLRRLVGSAFQDWAELARHELGEFSRTFGVRQLRPLFDLGFSPSEAAAALLHLEPTP